MSNYSYVAVDPHGSETRGTLDVPDQSEALRRIKEMGLFPTKVLVADKRPLHPVAPSNRLPAELAAPKLHRGIFRKVSPAALAVFTRQTATLIEAGMPLLRGLQTLQEQQESATMRQVIGSLVASIENGSSFAEALALHPKVFNRLYVNMVKAGELSGALELTLKRLAEFMEKAQQIKGKVKAALFYPCAVLGVAAAILVLMMVFVVPRFNLVFAGLMNGRSLPPFTLFIMHISEAVRTHIVLVSAALLALYVCFTLSKRTRPGRWTVDRFKLAAPIVGPLFRKVAISRFTRTLGTLVSSGVPILQALAVVKETAGNMVLSGLISTVQENVKQGDPIAPTLKASRLFPAMVAGMIDVGEQTGALPELLLKVAETYDSEVDNAVEALTSLLEPILIVFLAVIVGSIVVAMYLPILYLINTGFTDPNSEANDP